MVNNSKESEFHVSLGTEQLFVLQNDDAFCITLLKGIKQMNMPSPANYFIDNKKPLHKVVREDGKSFHVLLGTASSY